MSSVQNRSHPVVASALPALKLLPSASPSLQSPPLRLLPPSPPPSFWGRVGVWFASLIAAPEVAAGSTVFLQGDTSVRPLPPVVSDQQHVLGIGRFGKTIANTFSEFATTSQLMAEWASVQSQLLYLQLKAGSDAAFDSQLGFLQQRLQLIEAYLGAALMSYQWSRNLKAVASALRVPLPTASGAASRRGRRGVDEEDDTPTERDLTLTTRELFQLMGEVNVEDPKNWRILVPMNGRRVLPLTLIQKYIKQYVALHGRDQSMPAVWDDVSKVKWVLGKLRAIQRPESIFVTIDHATPELSSRSRRSSTELLVQYREVLTLITAQWPRDEKGVLRNDRGKDLVVSKIGFSDGQALMLKTILKSLHAIVTKYNKRHQQDKRIQGMPGTPYSRHFLGWALRWASEDVTLRVEGERGLGNQVIIVNVNVPNGASLGSRAELLLKAMLVDRPQLLMLEFRNLSIQNSVTGKVDRVADLLSQYWQMQRPRLIQRGEVSSDVQSSIEIPAVMNIIYYQLTGRVRMEFNREWSTQRIAHIVNHSQIKGEPGSLEGNLSLLWQLMSMPFIANTGQLPSSSQHVHVLYFPKSGQTTMYTTLMGDLLQQLTAAKVKQDPRFRTLDIPEKYLELARLDRDQGPIVYEQRRVRRFRSNAFPDEKTRRSIYGWLVARSGELPQPSQTVVRRRRGDAGFEIIPILE